MSVPSQILGLALFNAVEILNQITLRPRNSIGGIDIQATLEEDYEDTLQVTDHPVEANADITDHSYNKPSQVYLRCGWSNSVPGILGGSIRVGAVSVFANGGGETVSDYVSGVYSQLRALKESRQPFTIQTSLRQYTNMLITSLRVTRDEKTSAALMVTAACREVILVDTQQSALPPMENQATPASTADVTDNGSQLLSPNASPSTGGSLPPDQWGPL